MLCWTADPLWKVGRPSSIWSGKEAECIAGATWNCSGQ
jgi:hypothetical protein